jgi:hypothetical protein
MKSSAVPCVMMILPPFALNFARLTSLTSIIEAALATSFAHFFGSNCIGSNVGSRVMMNLMV